MTTATNIEATAVNTVEWLASAETNIVVPVYQRQYRWDIGGCEQLLADIRAVSDTEDRHTHFIGSILSAVNHTQAGSNDNSGDASATGDEAQLVLIDGQQRITTLMLLIAALQHTVRAADPALAESLERVLVSPTDAARTKLRPHRAWAQVFERVVLGREPGPDEAADSRFDDNYAFFRSQISAEDAPRIWRGLQKLEHVSITLGRDANAQQTFESLNSTGEPLRDHELIHNYVLMGLSHAEQSEIEDEYWLPIEQNTGEFIGAFWRHYLVMTTGREVTVAGERGVYDAFRQEFPRLDAETLRAHAAEWRAYSEVYRTLLDPSLAADEELGRQYGYVNTFGRGMYPLVMRASLDHARGLIERAELIATLEHVQALQLRRIVVGLDNDRLVARLCRARAEGGDSLVHAIARITPSDARVRVALKFSPLPHAGYVLGRLGGVDPSAVLDVDHIVPQAPSDAWTGDGSRVWADYSDDEQNSHRALAKTLGNLALLEEDLAERAFDKSYPEKQRLAYGASAVPQTRALIEVPAWSTAAITARTVQLTEGFLALWARPADGGIDDDNLTPILDAVRRRGWAPGWQREYSYVEYCGEHWEVYDVKYLFNRIFKRLWADAHDAVVAYSTRRGGPIFDAQSWNGQWDAIAEGRYLYMGWDSKYMITAVQGALEEAGLAEEVFLKYRPLGG